MSESISSQIFVSYETVGFCKETTAQGLLLGGALLGLAVASIACAGLLLPHTSFGMAMASLGESALFWGTIAGCIASLISSTTVAVMHCAPRMHFFEKSRSDSCSNGDETSASRSAQEETATKEKKHSEPNIGIFYKIRDQNGQTIGYLLGTVHTMPFGWPGPNPTISRKIEKSTKVFIENAEGGTYPLISLFSNGVDYRVEMQANKLKKEVAYLDDQKIKKRILSFKNGRYGHFDDPSVLKKALAAWLLGKVRDPEAAQCDIRSEIIDYDSSGLPICQTRTQEDRESCANFYRFLSEERNKRWVRKTLVNELNAATKDSKIFIAAGNAHLWDWECDEFKFLGLIPMLQAKGWSFEKVG